MNISIFCTATLSKKLEKICEEGEPISIHIDPIRGNKAAAQLRIVTKHGVDISDIEEIGETSIIINGITVEEEAASVQSADPVTSFVGLDWPEKMAKTAPDIESPKPSKSKTKSKGKISVNRPTPKTAESPPVKAQDPLLDYVSSYDELQEELGAIKNIDQDIDDELPDRPLSREESIKWEAKLANVPRIKKPAYISNETGGRIEIADLGVTMKPYEIIDLSRLPAKNVMNSRDIKWLLDNKLAAFRTQADFLAYFENDPSRFETAAYDVPEVYGSAEEAMARMTSTPMVDAAAIDDSRNPFVTGEIMEVTNEEDVSMGIPEGMEGMFTELPSNESEKAPVAIEQRASDAPKQTSKSSKAKAIRRSSG